MELLLIHTYKEKRTQIGTATTNKAAQCALSAFPLIKTLVPEFPAFSVSGNAGNSGNKNNNNLSVLNSLFKGGKIMHFTSFIICVITNCSHQMAKNPPLKMRL